MKTNHKISLGILLLLLGMGVFYLYRPTTLSTQPPANMGKIYFAGDYQLQIKLDPEKPITGNNQLTLLIRDVNDQPVTDATLEAYAEMPAMGSMPAMREGVMITNRGSGLYQGQYSLSMNGLWPLTIHVKAPSLPKAKLLFDMSTSRRGVKLSHATQSQLSTSQSQAETVEQQSPAAFTVDNHRRQLIGITVEKVGCQKLVKTLTVNARVNYDQTRLTDVNLKYDAWIGQLNADFVGKFIRQGETLFTVYNPELVSAQDEYLNSLRQTRAMGLRKAAHHRLSRWDISTAQIKALEKRGRSRDYLPILAPVDGTIIEKRIVAGSATQAGERLLQLADLSSVWIEGEVYESDLPWIKTGLEVQITLPHAPGRVYTTHLGFVNPTLDPQTRSIVIRTKLANEQGVLRPDMYATMNIKIDLGSRLVVPEQAVIYSGEQRIVFIDQGEGRLLPKKIQTGLRNNDMIEVLDGLAHGDRIVTSGNFLIAAESKLKAGLAQW